MPEARVTLADARQLASTVGQQELRPGSYKRFSAIWQNFERYALAAAQVVYAEDVDEGLVQRFVSTRVDRRPAAPGTMRTRLAAVGYLFRVVRREGVLSVDPTAGVSVQARDAHVVRRLTDAEVERCRFAAQTAIDASHRYTATLAVLEAGASTGEAGCLRWEDVDPSCGAITVGGRMIVPTEWGITALQRARVAASTSSVCVLRSIGYDARRTSVSNVAREIFERAGLPWAEPRSLTAWCGRRVFLATGRVDEAARVIGFGSLDRTARLIGYDWPAEQNG